MRSLLILLLALVTNLQQSYAKIRHAKGRAKRQEAGGWEPSSWVWGDEGGGHGGGDWGPWSPPSPCSRPCGGGVANQTRTCRSSDCWGSGIRHFTCHLEECGDSLDFRAQQCAEYNQIPYEGIQYDWIPYTKAPNKCALNCMPKGERFYYRHSDKVVDGTLCSDESLDVCVNGECQHVGCDKMLGSQLEEDKCRVCGGDGSKCETKKDTLYSNEFKVGYNDLFMVPAGSTNIRVKEVQPSNNYLAIRNASNHYYLNGNWRIDYPRILRFAGTVFHYGRKPHGFFAPESIIALGPTTEILFVVLLYQERNPGIEYEYSLPEGSVIQTDPEGYTWFTSEFSGCSATCGGGFQSRRVWCAKVKDSTEASADLCDPAHEPASTETCATHPCPPEWSVPDWSPCSVSCGNGTQARTVYCQQVVSGGQAVLLNDSVCLESVGEKPETAQPCGDPLPCPIWHIGPWKPCDKLCGDGVKRRIVQCYRRVDGKIELLPESYCSEDDKPNTETPCNLRPCEGVDWVTGEWSGCSEKCGLSFETREAMCANSEGKIFNDSLCHEYRKPELKRLCDQSESCPSQWYASQWSPCSSKCGPGIQSRHVFCGSFSEAEGTVKKVKESECDSAKKFEDQQHCVGEGECKGEWFVGAYGQCSKPCGGGERSRKVLCFKNNETVKATECDADTIAFATSSCNSHPCGEDEILPVEPDSSIMEESSEECEEGSEEDVEEDVEEAEGEESGEDDSDAIKDKAKSKISATKKPTTIKISEDGEAESLENVIDLIDVRFGAFTPQKIEEEEGSGDISTVFTESGMVSSTDGVTVGATDASTDEPTGGLSDTEATTRYSSESSTVSLSDSSSSTTDSAGSSVGSTNIDLTSIMLSDGTSEDVSDATKSDIITKDIVTTVAFESSSKDVSTSTAEDITTSSENTPSSSTVMQTSESSTENYSTESITDASTTDSSTLSSEVTLPFSTTEPSSDASESSSGSTVSSDVTTSLYSVSSSTSSSDSTLATKETSVSSSVTESTSETSSESSWTSTMISSIVSLISDSSSERPTSSSSSESVSTASGPTDETSDSTETLKETSSETSVTSSDTTAESDLIRFGEGATEATASTEVSGPTETDMEERDDTTSWSQTIFGVTSSVESAVTREQTMKKCKKRPKIKKCVKSEFGCCPDGRTPAKGPFGKDCPKIETCKETKYSCCQDGVSPAKGLDFLGCPPSQCNETLFGCCPDNYTEALGNEFEGCPVTTTLAMDCSSSEFGCCPDGILSATGPNFAGCFECEDTGPCDSCGDTKFGCCPDNITQASGPNYEGCDLPMSTTEFMLISMGDSEECENSTYGCCPDGIKLATGPNDEGCETTEAPPVLHCYQTEFGCCPDGNSTATGPKYEGCKTSCATEPYGCCEDNTTPAHGDNKEGCCLSSPYGCCKDNIQPAEGPNYEGCSCDSGPYGCCPDGITAASGQANEGCGCIHTQHGCCPDKATPAGGPDFEGCPCYTYQFGCCPDGINHAVGLRMLGCGCENSPHGCCPDGITPKPDEGNCTCDATSYGCCLDGVTAAQSEKFEGCATKPRRPGDICGLPKDRGPCREFTVKWHYDTEYGGCSRFWFGSCEGNGNKFNSQEECKQFCVEPKGKDACYLPKISGPCQGYYPRWHYDSERKDCSQFIYGGCLGNNNKFQTVEECRELCVVPDNLDACDQQLDTGPCEGSFERFYYDKEAHACFSFQYGGCKGNKNNFPTEAACSAKCLSPQHQKSDCSLEKSEGECKEKQARWYFDATENRCMPFYYSGCGGNNNNFAYIEHCQEHCPAKLEVPLCGQPAVEGDCHNFTIRYYFDSLESKCKQFYYSGCKGNTNNFQTEFECYKQCEPSKLPPEPEEPPFTQDMCMLPYESGTCSDSISSWFFDRRDGLCKEFEYSGCHGNGNRFHSIEECEESCEGVIDICRLGTVQVRCDTSNSATMYYYDPASESCRQYADTLCPGNGNRFQSREQCQARCRPGGVRPPVTQAPYLPDICWARLDPGPCLNQMTAWWYDQSTGRCQPFVYGGCEGNANRFSSEEQCERQCGQFRRHDTCWENKDVGSCDQVQSKFFFNSVSKKCEEFLYSGCGGNTNRYSTVDECVAVCIRKQEPPITQGENTHVADQEICRLPVEPGSCSGYIERYHFDENSKTCSPFVFTGCSANLNNFNSYDECMAFCAPELSHGPNEVGLDDCYEEESECSALTDCSYGIEKKSNSRGCVICSCHMPCEGFDCGSDSLCSVRSQTNPVTLNIEFIPVCNPISKAGQCPEVSLEASCDEECNRDTQCPGIEKCCYNGCGTQCLVPVFEDEDVTTARPQPPQGVDPPQILTDDDDTNVVSEEGNFASLKCIVRGSPVPQISWKKDGVLINSTGTSKYRMLSDGTLQVIGLIKDDSGLYICIAENGIGRSITKEFRLQVNVPVKVRIHVDKTTYAPGQDISLPCDVEGFPTPQVTWYKNGEQLYSSNRITITDSHRLMLKECEISDSGRYRCHADNTYTSSEAVVDILVKGIFVPADCTDNPFFANCKLIVQGNYCPHEYYAKFCCKSCTEAGQIQHTRFKRSLRPTKKHQKHLSTEHPIQMLPLYRHKTNNHLPLTFLPKPSNKIN